MCLVRRHPSFVIPSPSPYERAYGRTSAALPCGGRDRKRSRALSESRARTLYYVGQTLGRTAAAGPYTSAYTHTHTHTHKYTPKHPHSPRRQNNTIILYLLLLYATHYYNTRYVCVCVLGAEHVSCSRGIVSSRARGPYTERQADQPIYNRFSHHVPPSQKLRRRRVVLHVHYNKIRVHYITRDCIICNNNNNNYL